ncbi:DUF397 domain-containing protein [Streptomyces alboflavus]|uniref:DUF397 domain-containing protein n=1 Tax=Streptomyces alboflavus TaxID=67267 RepID=UPI0036BF197A
MTAGERRGMRTRSGDADSCERTGQGGGVADAYLPAAQWFKSSYTAQAGGDCVEVARPGDRVWVRDSNRRGETHLAVTPPAWRAFVRAVASGRVGVE